MDIKESYKKVDYNAEWAIKMQKRKENEDWGWGKANNVKKTRCFGGK